MAKTLLVLTACVTPILGTVDTPEQRRQIYERNLRLWLDRTTLPVLIVDSSGHKFEGFEHERLVGVVSVTLPDVNHCSSVYEALSLLAVMSSDHAKPYDRFVKVTARYFCPGLEALLNEIPDDVSIIHQSMCSENWCNSEVFGFTREVFVDLFKHVVFQGKFMENALYSVQTAGPVGRRSARLPQIAIHELVRRGGDGLTLPHL